MPLHKSVVLPNMVTAEFHKIVKVESDKDVQNLTLVVASWVDEAQYLSGAPAVWNDRITSPVSEDFYESLPGLLNESLYSAATSVPDGALTLAHHKKLGWGRIKQSRDEAEYKPVEYETKYYDADPDSQRRIIGANVSVLRAQIQWLTSCMSTLAEMAGVELPTPPNTAIPWTTEDNQVELLGPQDLQGLGDAVIAQAASCHATGRTLRGQIDSAESLEEVEAVRWPTT